MALLGADQRLARCKRLPERRRTCHLPQNRDSGCAEPR
jgi:hypothetical protein